MAGADTTLERRARRAYEYGRLLHGLRRATLVAPMVALSLLVCGHPTATWVTGGALVAAVVLFEWRGQGFAVGSRVGLWAGLPPLLLPLAVQATGHLCSPSLCRVYPAMCLLGGILGGVLLARLGMRSTVHGTGLAAAALVAGLAGTLGCVIGGLGGFVGLVAGLTLGAAPVLALRRV